MGVKSMNKLQQSSYGALLLSTLLGCQTIDAPKVAINPALDANAIQLTAKRPSGWLSDKAYEQQQPLWQVERMDVSWQQTETVPMTALKARWQQQDLDNLFVFMLLDIEEYHPWWIEQNALFHQQRFSFDLAYAEGRTHADCRILSTDAQQVYRRNQQQDIEVQSQQRSQSTLGCRLTEQGQVTEFLLDSVKGQAPRVRLNHGGEGYRVQPLTRLLYAQDGQWRALPNFGGQQIHGFEFYRGSQAMAAVNLRAEPLTIRLNPAQSATEQRLLLAASYSLLMLEFLDAHWQSESL